MSAKLERLTNLVALLLETTRPLPLEEIRDRVAGYDASLDPESGRRQFERDKDSLRAIGIPLSVVELAHPAGTAGYRIMPGDYYLPDLHLDEEEQAALATAVQAVRLEGGESREAIWKLGGAQGDAGPPLAAFEGLPELTTLFEAVRARHPVAFRYRGEARRLEPYAVVFRDGHWYVVGRDVARDAERSFRADRLSGGVEVDRSLTFVRPADFDPSRTLRTEPWEFGEDAPVEAHVLVRRAQAGWAVGELGEGAVVRRHDDGSVEFRLLVTNPSGFRSFVLGLLDDAEVLGPPDLRADLVAWVRDVATASS